MRWTGQIFWLLALFRHPPDSPSSRLHPRKVSGIGPIGKSYPVTAAQLLPIRTGFLAPIHFSKLAKNWIEKYPLARGAARFISQLSGLRRHKPPAKCDNRAIGRQRFFLHGESLKDRVALLCRSDRVGYVPKIIGRVLSNEAA